MNEFEFSTEIARKYDALLNPDKKDLKMIDWAEDVRCRDQNGIEYINLNEISFSLGYNNKKFVSRVANAFREKLAAPLGDISYEKSFLLERLVKAASGRYEKIYLAGGGGEVIDWSIKVAKRYTGKDEIISFWHALHGRSFAGAALSGVQTRKAGFGSVMPGLLFMPYPNCKNCSFGCSMEDCHFRCIQFISDSVKYGSTNNVAAIIIEPVQPLDGMATPIAGYFKQLRQLADDIGALIILDEVQTCFGRTGSMFFFEKAQVDADIICLGKGMSNGFGIGALLMKKNVGDAVKYFELSGGSADHAFNCSVINTVMDIFEEDKILDNVKLQSDIFKNCFMEAMATNRSIKEIKCSGLAIGIELSGISAYDVSAECQKNGVMVGTAQNNLLIRPPLVINSVQSQKSAEIIIAAITSLSKKYINNHI